jgi:hypothetical protein
MQCSQMQSKLQRSGASHDPHTFPYRRKAIRKFFIIASWPMRLTKHAELRGTGLWTVFLSTGQPRGQSLQCLVLETYANPGRHTRGDTLGSDHTVAIFAGRLLPMVATLEHTRSFTSTSSHLAASWTTAANGSNNWAT